MRERFPQLVRETVVYAVGLILRRGLSIVTLPVFARHLSAAEFGTLAVLGTLRDLLTVVFELGMPNASVRFFYDCRTDADRRRLFGSLQIFLALASVVFTLLVLLAGPAAWSTVAPEIPFHPYVSLTLLTVLLSGASILPRGLLRVTHRTGLFATLGLVQGLITAGVSIGLVVVWEYGVLGAVVGSLVTAAVFVPVHLVLLRGYFDWRFSPALVARCLAFGLSDVPVRVGLWTLRVADRLILQAYVPLAAVGVYSMGYVLGATAFELIGSSANAAILPFFYRTAEEDPGPRSRALFADLAAWHVALFAFLGLGVILFARELILLLATERYVAAAAIVPFVVWASVFQTMSHIPMRAVYVARKTAHLPLVFVVPAALNIALNFMWVPRYGIMGAAVATAVTYPLMTVMQFWVAQRVYPIPYRYGRMAVPLVILVVLTLLASLAPGEPLPAAFAFKALLLAAFPLALWLSGFIGKRDRRAAVALARNCLARRRASRPPPTHTEESCERHSSMPTSG